MNSEPPAVGQLGCVGHNEVVKVIEDSYMMESREERSLFGDIEANMSIENPQDLDKSDTNSCEDLFDSCADIFGEPDAEETVETSLQRSKRQSNDFEWENFSQMSTQQLAQHFSFQLSESDGSEELF